jgi:hypothetical protein
MTNGSTWKRVVQAARQEAKDARDWGRANAIERAQRYLQDPEVTRVWDETTDTLIVESPQSGETYVTNGTCQRLDGTPCPAFADGRPCWHIEGKGLLRRLIDSIPPPEADLLPQPIPVPPSTDNEGAQAVVLEAVDEPEAEEVLVGATLHLSSEHGIPLIVDSRVVAYADTMVDAEQWFRRNEPFFMNLED